MFDLNDIKTSLQILIKRPNGENQKEKMQSFYDGQEKDYDRYRKKLLHGKENLFKGVFDKVLPSFWCDLGCGTAENLESVGIYLDLKK